MRAAIVMRTNGGQGTARPTEVCSGGAFRPSSCFVAICAELSKFAGELNFMARFYEQLVAALAENRPFTLTLISGVKGSSPQRAGAKALFFLDGKIVGTLGGGCLEAEVHARAKKALQTGQPTTFEMVLDHDFGWDDGLICGGSVTGLILPHAPQVAELWRQLAAVTGPIRWGVKKDFSITRVEDKDTGDWFYQETVTSPFALWIAGSGHVAQAVACIYDFRI